MIKRTIYFGSPCYLSTKLNQLVISQVLLKNDPVPNTIPIEDIGVLVLDNQQICITQGLIQQLIENNVAIIHCNFTHHPIGLVLPMEGNNVQSQRFRVQIEASEPLKKQLWQQVVSAKIRNQAFLLKTSEKPYNTLERMASMVRSGDTENLEAQAAVYYWSRIFDETLQFRRGREGNYPNNMLNYGYAILRATIARALVGAGLLPTLGIHHTNKYNAFCLADDMMEAYRPFVDKIVLDLVKENKGLNEELDKPTKAKLLEIITTDVWLDDERSPLMNATHRTATSLYKCYAGQSRKLLLPKFV
jgi:CRISPR-associated protein Cas1